MSTGGLSATPTKVPTAASTSASPADPPQPAGNTGGAPDAGDISPASVNTSDASAVAIAAVTTINRHDTAIDASPLDALRRAARWLSPTLVHDSLDVPERGDADWTTLAGHHGYTVVAQVQLANETGQPPNTATRVYEQISYTLIDIGRDGWRGLATGPQVARLELTSTGSGTATRWQVSAFLGDKQ